MHTCIVFQIDGKQSFQLNESDPSQIKQSVTCNTSDPAACVMIINITNNDILDLYWKSNGTFFIRQFMVESYETPVCYFDLYYRKGTPLLLHT